MIVAVLVFAVAMNLLLFGCQTRRLLRNSLTVALTAVVAMGVVTMKMHQRRMESANPDHHDK